MANTRIEPPFLIFGSPLSEQAEIDEVVACMESAWLGTGSRVAQFERDFAAYQGLQPSQVAAVNFATATLHVRMAEAAITPRTRAILPVHYAGRLDGQIATLEQLAEQGGIPRNPAEPGP